MKRIYELSVILLLSASDILSSCQQETLGNEEAMSINFSQPQIDVETRSTTKDVLEVGDAFGVLGYCVPYYVNEKTLNYNGGVGIWAVKKKLCPPDVFYMQKVIVGANGCKYDRNGGDANNPKFWYREGYDTDNNANGNVVSNASDYKYTFYAYYPYDDCFSLTSPNDEEAKGAPIFKFTMPQTGGDLETPLNHTLTPDAMLAVLYDKTQQEGSMQFNFFHILTALGFEVNNFSQYDLTIHSIKLGGSFYKEIEIDLTDNVAKFSFPEKYYTGSYIILDKGDDGYMLKAPDTSKGETVTSSPSPIGPVLDGTICNEFIMLISGIGTSFGKDDIRVYLDYTFYDSENGLYKRKTAELTRPGTFTPKPGTKYTAQLNFVGDAFVINFVVDNSGEWEDGSNADGSTENDDIVFE